MGSWFWPERSTEASLAQLVTTGAAGGGYAVDPVDGDVGYTSIGTGAREVPGFTLEKQRAYSIAAYRLNPMARAIIDTYVAFAVGDSGLSVNCTNGDVETVVQEFVQDPRVRLLPLQDLMLRDHMLAGESVLEMMVGPLSGRTRINPINAQRVTRVELLGGNPLWPDKLGLRAGLGEPDFTKQVVAVDDITNLRTGEVQWWASWKASLDDRRGQPFLAPILDWLDSYDDVLSNLVDRTALARYLVWDVTLDGASPEEIKQFLKDRGGNHLPRSGSIEVHNESVSWKPQTAQTGAVEDTEAGKSILTSVAAGAGLAKTWLSEPGDSNRATSLTMAEPVRRRVGQVQNLWLGYQMELLRYVVDQAVRARRLPDTVETTDRRTASTIAVPASMAVSITGPEIAAADAQVTAEILVNLSKGLSELVDKGVLSTAAAQVLAKKAWEQFAGVPYTADLDKPDADPNDVATAVDDGTKSGTTSQPAMRAV
jgi:hypothetical protein